MAAITVRELVTKWGFDIDMAKVKAMDESIDRIKSNAKLAGQAFLGSGALGGAISYLVGATARFSDELERNSQILGIGVERLQQYYYVAARAGIPQEEFNTLLQRFSRSISDAANGTGEAKDTLYALGVQLTDINGRVRKTESVFFDVADAIARIPNQQDRVRVSMELFGRSGARMLNIFQQGSPEIRRLMAEAVELGGVLDENSVRAGQRFHDTLEAIFFVVRGFRNYLGSAMIPAFQEIADKTIEWAKANKEWIRGNLRKAAEDLSGVVVTLFDYLKSGIDVTLKLVSAFGGLANILKVTVGLLTAYLAITTINAVGGLVQGVWAIAAAMRAAGASALFMNAMLGLTTFITGVLVIALALLAEDIYGYFHGKDSLIGGAIDWTANMLAEIIDQLKWIGNFWKSGLSGVPFIGDMFSGVDAFEYTSPKFRQQYYGETPQQYQGPIGPSSPLIPQSQVNVERMPFGSPSYSTRAELNVNVQGLPSDKAADVVIGAVKDALDQHMRDAQASLSMGAER